MERVYKGKTEERRKGGEVRMQVTSTVITYLEKAYQKSVLKMKSRRNRLKRKDGTWDDDGEKETEKCIWL